MEYLFPMIMVVAVILSATKKMRKSWDDIAVDPQNEGQDISDDESEKSSKKAVKTPPPLPSKESDVILSGDLTQKRHPIIQDFDLKKAVIYREILSPKWKEYGE